MGWMANATPWPLLQKTVQTPNVQEAGWAPGTVWVGLEKRKLRFPYRFSKPERFSAKLVPILSQALYVAFPASKDLNKVLLPSCQKVNMCQA